MKKNIFLLMIAVSLFSCENEIPYNIKDPSPKLTMNGFLNTDSTQNYIYLNYTGKFYPEDVTQATVEVYINGELKETAREAEPLEFGDTQKRYVITSKFKPGDRVKIEARTEDDKHHVWVEESVPHPVDILSVDTINIPLKDNDYRSYYKKLRLNIKFQDRPNEKNFYRITLQKKTVVTGKDNDEYERKNEISTYGLWSWDDIALTDGIPASNEELENDLFERIANVYGVFDDSRFTDKEYTLNIQAWIDSYFNDFGMRIPETIQTDLVIRLYSITKIEYEYFKVLNYLKSDVYDEFLNDPVKIPSNVHGGVGVVCFNSGNSEILYSAFKKKLIFEEEYY